MLVTDGICNGVFYSRALNWNEVVVRLNIYYFTILNNITAKTTA